jgi:hypothetical protein
MWVSLCGAREERSKHRADFFIFIMVPRYIRRLIDEYTAMYICRLTNECMGLCSLVEDIFLCSSTKEYSTFEFLGTEECTPFPIVSDWTGALRRS